MFTYICTYVYENMYLCICIYFFSCFVKSITLTDIYFFHNCLGLNRANDKTLSGCHVLMLNALQAALLFCFICLSNVFPKLLCTGILKKSSRQFCQQFSEMFLISEVELSHECNLYIELKRPVCHLDISSFTSAIHGIMRKDLTCIYFALCICNWESVKTSQK